jgi:hypothetical protein
MIDLSTQKAWLIKVIDSCFTKEQLDSSMYLITLFVTQLKLKGVSLKECKDVEDELLEKYLEKEAMVVTFNV